MELISTSIKPFVATLSRYVDSSLLMRILVSICLSMLIAASAQISVPFGAVPFTLQALAILGIACIAPTDVAIMSVCFYLLEGALGLPVFAYGYGGAHVLFAAPTSGYLWGFLMAVIVMQAWMRGSVFVNGMTEYLWVFLGLLVSLACIYLPGLFVLSLYVGGLDQTLAQGFYPFIWFDILKSAIILCFYVVIEGVWSVD